MPCAPCYAVAAFAAALARLMLLTDFGALALIAEIPVGKTLKHSINQRIMRGV